MGCRLAMLLIIVKTLVCTRAIKGFYYDERLCRHAKLLVDHVENLERVHEKLERLRENLGGVEMGPASVMLGLWVTRPRPDPPHPPRRPPQPV